MVFLPAAGVGVVLVAGLLWVATDPVRPPAVNLGPAESTPADSDVADVDAADAADTAGTD